MGEGRETRVLTCPACGRTEAFVRIPDAAYVSGEESADGSVEATCLACDERFSAYYRRDD